MTERDNGNTSNISWLRRWLEQFQRNVRPAVAWWQNSDLCGSSDVPTLRSFRTLPYLAGAQSTHVILRVPWKFPLGSMASGSTKSKLCSVFQLCVIWSDGVVWEAENLIRLSLWGQILLYLCDWSLRPVPLQRGRAVVAFIIHKILVVLLILRELPFGQQVKCALSVFWKEGFVWICEKEHGSLQFGFATSKCHRASGGEEGGDGAAGEGFAWVFLGW